MNKIYCCYSCKKHSSSNKCDLCGKDISKTQRYVYICPRCGEFSQYFNLHDKEELFCSTCSCDLLEVESETYVKVLNECEPYKLDTEKVPIKKRAAYRLIHERPEFSYEAFEKFYASLTEKAEDNDSKWHNVKPASVSVKCPRCGSTKTSKISSLSKAVSIAAFGIFSQKRKYQWHCNNCGSDF